MSQSVQRLVLWHRLLPGEGDAPQEAVAWVRSVAARLHAAGGTLLGALGSHVAASFEEGEAEDALEEALALLKEARSRPTPLPVALGAELGTCAPAEAGSGAPAPWQGEALEVASLAASRAGPGEILLGPKLAEALPPRTPLGPTRGVPPLRPLLGPIPQASAPPPPPARSSRAAVLIAAARRGDGEALAREARRALAEGCPPAAARRFLALARLLGGDPEGALQLLSSERPEDSSSRGRQALARGLVLLASGQPRAAVGEGLAALHAALEGEAEPARLAALALLARAYRQLGLDREARALSAAAAAQ